MSKDFILRNVSNRNIRIYVDVMKGEKYLVPAGEVEDVRVPEGVLELEFVKDLIAKGDLVVVGGKAGTKKTEDTKDVAEPTKKPAKKKTTRAKKAK